MKKFLPVLFLVSAFFFLFFPLRKDPTERQESPTPFPASREKIQVLASNLEIPWELAFLPDEQMLVTERSGRLLLVGSQKQEYEVREVAHIGEGGLLGMALDPDFPRNNFIYLYFTYREGGKVLNKVQKFSVQDGSASGGKFSLVTDEVIIENIPGSNNHDGGRIKFGPDGKLYITTGDAQNPNSAQDLASLAGKILRLNSDGSIPSDNPFEDSPVYSYGHRNPQGLAWDEDGGFWATEHGQNAQDEINRIEAGKNYGWPVIRGNQVKGGMESPILQSGSETWAPSGGAIKDSKFYFGGLAGRSIVVYSIKTKETREFFKGQFGRIRSVNLGADGNFYIVTSNRDGRNTKPDPADDRLIKISSDLFN